MTARAVRSGALLCAGAVLLVAAPSNAGAASAWRQCGSVKVMLANDQWTSATGLRTRGGVSCEKARRVAFAY